MGQSIIDQNGVGYNDVTKHVATSFKTTFQKSVSNMFAFGKNFNSSMSEGKKRFVPVYHYSNMFGHICLKCFEYKSTFKMGNKSRFVAYKPRFNVNVKLIWKIILSRKYELKNQI